MLFSGIAEKLDYVNNYLNASMVLINPIYQSNGFGDEAIDYMKIAEDLGTGEDFDKLVKILHKKGIIIHNLQYKLQFIFLILITLICFLF